MSFLNSACFERHYKILWTSLQVFFCTKMETYFIASCGPRQANLVLTAYASREGSGEPAHPRSLARTIATRSYKQWIKRNLQTESQIPGPSEWLGMRSWNLSWRNARRHKFAWRGSCDVGAQEILHRSCLPGIIFVVIVPIILKQTHLQNRLA